MHIPYNIYVAYNINLVASPSGMFPRSRSGGTIHTLPCFSRKRLFLLFEKR